MGGSGPASRRGSVLRWRTAAAVRHPGTGSSVNLLDADLRPLDPALLRVRGRVSAAAGRLTPRARRILPALLAAAALSAGAVIVGVSYLRADDDAAVALAPPSPDATTSSSGESRVFPRVFSEPFISPTPVPTATGELLAAQLPGTRSAGTVALAPAPARAAGRSEQIAGRPPPATQPAPAPRPPVQPATPPDPPPPAPPPAPTQTPPPPEPTDPPPEPTDPPPEPTDPPPEPTDPPSEPTDPPSEPTDPPSEPTDP